MAKKSIAERKQERQERDGGDRRQLLRFTITGEVMFGDASELHSIAEAIEAAEGSLADNGDITAVTKFEVS